MSYTMTEQAAGMGARHRKAGQPVTRWDEPAQASSPRGWLHVGELVVGFYLAYGPEHYRYAHDAYPRQCESGAWDPCRECQPGNVLAVRYPDGPGSEGKRSRYVETVAEARAYVESGELVTS